MSEIAVLSTPVEPPPTPRGVAYSYVRFSTVKQELGDSLRRQVTFDNPLALSPCGNRVLSSKVAVSDCNIRMMT